MFLLFVIVIDVKSMTETMSKIFYKFPIMVISRPYTLFHIIDDANRSG